LARHPTNIASTASLAAAVLAVEDAQRELGVGRRTKAPSSPYLGEAHLDHFHMHFGRTPAHFVGVTAVLI